MDYEAILNEIVSSHCENELLVPSRIHTISGLENAFIKRDDELGQGIEGSKRRKYASLLPAFQTSGADIMEIQGSLHSNNALALALLARERNIDFYFSGEAAHASRGNLKWIRNLFPEAINGESKADGKKVFRVAEGANQVESLPGLFSLALEIHSFEQKTGRHFETIYCDAGTGITAIALMLGLSFLSDKKRQYQICLIAGTKETFEQNFSFLKEASASQIHKRFQSVNPDFELHRPHLSPSFGSVNASIKKKWCELVQQYGILFDLTYSAKHFHSFLENRKNDAGFLQLYLHAGSAFSARNHESLLD